MERGESRMESWEIETLKFVPNEKELRINGPRNNRTERSQWIVSSHEGWKHHQCHIIPSKRTSVLCNGRILKILQKAASPEW